MGLLMTIIILFFIWYVMFRLPMLAFRFFKDIFSGIYHAKTTIDSQNEIIKELDENNYLNKKMINKSLKEQEKQEKYNQEIIKQQNQIVSAAIYKTNELRVRYPYANKNLFDQYLQRYPFALLDELQKIEDSIKNSHEINYYNYDIPKKYNIKDTEEMEIVNTYIEDPLIFKIFKNDRDYLILAKNLDNDECKLLQSRDYMVITTTINNIIERQKQLKEFKLKMKSEEIDIIYDKVSAAIEEMKRTGELNI